MKKSYMSLIGQLNWLVSNTRPDIVFGSCDLNISYNKDNFLKLNKLISGVTHDVLKLFFPNNITNKMLFWVFFWWNLCQTLKTYQRGVCVCHGKGSFKGFWESPVLSIEIKECKTAELIILNVLRGSSLYCNYHYSVGFYWDKFFSFFKNLENKRLKLDLTIIKDIFNKRERNNVSWVIIF